MVNGPVTALDPDRLSSLAPGARAPRGMVNGPVTALDPDRLSSLAPGARAGRGMVNGPVTALHPELHPRDPLFVFGPAPQGCGLRKRS